MRARRVTPVVVQVYLTVFHVQGTRHSSQLSVSLIFIAPNKPKGRSWPRYAATWHFPRVKEWTPKRMLWLCHRLDRTTCPNHVTALDRGIRRFVNIYKTVISIIFHASRNELNKGVNLNNLDSKFLFLKEMFLYTKYNSFFFI